jgi:DNA replication protein DnaC
MTLLLGPPSSGKTSLLLALAGKLDKDLKVNNCIQSPWVLFYLFILNSKFITEVLSSLF